MDRFENRREAGRRLAAALRSYAGQPKVLVLGLPRGGVPVAYEVAQVLQAPLDVCVVRKLGVPGHAELAMGAIGRGGVRVLDQETIQALHLPPTVVDAVTGREQEEMARRESLYRRGRPAPPVRDHTVILVDDGLATGATMRAAIATLRPAQPRRIVVAVPVAAPQMCAQVRADAEEVVCLLTPEPFYAVGVWYEDFAPTSDKEVCRLLDQAAHAPAVASGTAPLGH